MQERRKEKRLTQSQLALKIGVHKNTVSQWELGKMIPHIKHQVKLSKILDCPIAQLFDSDAKPKLR